MSVRSGILLGCLAATLSASASASAAEPREGAAAFPARVSANGRYLVDAAGKPFFYLGDTAWELFHRLTREEADRYLADRAAKGFTVIQAVALSEIGGFDEPNAYGHRPFAGRDLFRPAVAPGPQDDYWDHVDHIVARANALGLTVGFLPAWGSYWHDPGKGTPTFGVADAEAYGRWLGQRYRDAGLIWILGGDRRIDEPAQGEVIRAMARGLKDGDGGRHLGTFHPTTGPTSAKWFHGDAWLDFNMLQSGHDRRNTPNYLRIAEDYARVPAKPCMDSEPNYERIPVGFKSANGFMTDADVRKAAYWAVFAGALGHTYGANEIWQMYAPGRAPMVEASLPWTEALSLPGAGQMRHLRRLIESRPFLTRIPDQRLLRTPPGEGPDHAQATRDADGSYAMVYAASGRPFAVDLTRLTGDRLVATWFDPRDGSTRPLGTVARDGDQTFTPPTQGEGHDWVLLLDDASRSYRDPAAP